MSKVKKISLFFILTLILLVFSSSILSAITQEECEKSLSGRSLEDLQWCNQQFEQQLSKLDSQERTLGTEVKRFDTAIALTTNKILTTIKEIENLEKEIASLVTKIGRLDVSLDQLSEILIKRVAETYKKGKIDTLALFLSSQSFSDFVSRYKYLQVMQLNDRRLIIQMETVRTNYEDQKKQREEKQEELEKAKKKLESQKALLAVQKKDKENLLRITQNNKSRYQQLLTISRAEIEAIQEIIAGRGQCAEVGKISQGARIATVITGASPCSTGTHLHFQVVENKNVKNPFSYLRGISVVDESGGDPHQASGDWDWPLNEPIRLTQGFGSDTSAIRSRIVWYNFHTGIDIVSGDLTVKSVKQGALYQCSIACGNRSLRYVRVDHDDSEIDTYYLHVNY